MITSDSQQVLKTERLNFLESRITDIEEFIQQKEELFEVINQITITNLELNKKIRDDLSQDIKLYS